MGFTYTDLNDLLNMTHEKYPEKGMWVDLTSDIQEYIAAPKLLKKNKRRVTSGDYINWPLQIAMADDGGGIAPYEEVQRTQNNQMTTCTLRWGGIYTDCMWDLIEMQQNAESETRIVDLIKARRHGRKVKLWDLCEVRFWTAESSDGGVLPYSLFHSVREYAVAVGNHGFNGPYPFSGSSIYGVTNKRLQNWTDTYAAVTAADLLAKMRRAAFKCKFSPVPDAGLLNTADQRFEIFVNYDTYAELLTLAESRNENLTFDLNRANGRVTFGGAVFTPVPYADEITNWGTYDWVIMLDWSTLEPVFLSGFEEDTKLFEPTKDQPNVVVEHVQSVYNMRNIDPRRSAFLTKKTS